MININAKIKGVKVTNSVEIKYEVLGDSNDRIRYYTIEKFQRFLRNFKVKNYEDLVGKYVYVQPGYYITRERYQGIDMIYTTYYKADDTIDMKIYHVIDEMIQLIYSEETTSQNIDNVFFNMQNLSLLVKEIYTNEEIKNLINKNLIREAIEYTQTYGKKFNQ